MVFFRMEFYFFILEYVSFMFFIFVVFFLIVRIDEVYMLILGCIEIKNVEFCFFFIIIIIDV